MSDFTNLQEQLQQLRQQQRTNENELARHNARLQQTNQSLRNLSRVNNGQDGQYRQLQAALEGEQQERQQQVTNLRGKIKETAAADKELAARFNALADPSLLVEQLPDDTPFLLFPVRLETRFKKINGQDELWIRIYPDDCLVDTFQEILTGTEIEQAKLFWAAYWQAGKIEEQQRAAWRALVASFGSGRATWIYRQYRPLNETEQPAKARPEDMILTIATDTPLPATDITAAADFWRQAWLANGNTAKEQAAFQLLKTKLGDAAAGNILENYAPVNIEQDPPGGFARNAVQLSVAFLVLPADATIDAGSSSWSQAPKAHLLPDRFVAMGFDAGNQQVFMKTGLPLPASLDIGIDPSLPKAEQVQATPEGNLTLNEGLQWLTDFDMALSKGMAMKIAQQDLSKGKIADGFDKLLVMGLYLSMDDAGSSKQLDNLLQHHYHSKGGFSLMPQGTATNNTEEASGYSRLDNADASYDTVFNDKDLFVETDDAWEKKDGQWLAQSLNLNTDFFKQVPFAGSNDMGEARAMNTALWPATMGYFMDEMMGKVFSDDDMANTRTFFNEYVSGYGIVPAIRIGTQPYGILPVTAYSRLRFPEGNNNIRGVALPRAAFTNYLNKLQGVLGKMDADWTKMSADVANVNGGAADPYQQLMDIIALQGSSVEFYQRYAESALHINNAAKFSYGSVFALALASFLQDNAKRLLAAWGVDTTEDIPILSKLFLSHQNPLQGPIIDDRPLSEQDPVRVYSADNKNYLQWLADAPLDQLLSENFGGNKAPAALLYIMLRHALMEQHNNTSVQLYGENNVFANAKLAMREPDLLYVTEKPSGDSKLKYLYQPEPAITKKPGLTVADYIYQELRPSFTFTNYYLSQVIKALHFLQDRSTARLERAFTAHLDCCGYRLDAWIQGLVQYRLEEQQAKRAQRRDPNGGAVEGKGIYLGAYGYVEKLFPENKDLTAVQLDADLGSIFNDSPDLPPLQKDPTNAGYIHAPSINQATTSAILKNAYLSNASKKENNPFSINISSERVRLATGILDGIRNGQSLSALLGYRFERGLHDKHALGQGEVDVLIYPLRMLFPLASQNIKTDTPPAAGNEPQSIEQLEARNVIDGLKLISHVKKTGNTTYPFGFPIGDGPGQLPAASNTQINAVGAEVLALLNVNDAVADLVMAESVHQAVQGNTEKSSANTDITGKGAYPPETEFINTPRSGKTLTNRISIHFDAGAIALPSDTPRARLEPAMNKWLRELLPAPAAIACKVDYSFPDPALNNSTVVTLKQLGLDAIDLVYLLDLDTEKGMNELDDRLERIVKKTKAPHPGAAIKIAYTEPVAGQIGFFEIASLVKSLNSILLFSRHLEPSDLALPSDKNIADALLDDAELAVRITAIKNDLQAFLPKLQTLIADLASATDDYASAVEDLYTEMAAYNIQGTGTGFIGNEIRFIYQSIWNRLDKTATRWDQKNTDYLALEAGYGALATDDERFTLLQNMERIISTTYTAPLPANPATFKTNLENFRVSQFLPVLQEIRNLQKLSIATLKDFMDAVEPVVKNKLAPFDLNFFNPEKKLNTIDAEKDSFLAFRQTLNQKLVQLNKDLEKQLTDANDLLNQAAAEKKNKEKIKILINAAKKLMGEDASVLPKFILAGAQADETGNAFNDAPALLNYLTNDLKKKFPVEDWLYGAARVRAKLQHFENLVMLTNGFGTKEPELVPMQFPYRKDDRWLGMEFPEAYTIDSEKLLYTPHFATGGFNKASAQCGVVVDEWVEIIPGDKENTGIAFHYDQPNTEPPQAMLLVTPPVFKGHWAWQDVTDAVLETFAMAKKRAVDPQLIDKSDYAQVLPATMMGVTLFLMTISTNLAQNNKIYEKIKPN